MKLSAILRDRVGIECVKSSDAEGFFDEITARIVATGDADAAAQASLKQGFEEREKRGTTAFGFSVAIPHVFHPAVKRIVVIVARAPTGIAFGAVDGQPTTTFICVAGPESEREDYLKLLAALARTLRDRNWRKFILQAPDTKSVFDILLEASPD